MESDNNRRLVQHVYAEVSKGNPAPLLEAMADDVRWTVVGSNKFSGTFHSKQEALEKLIHPITSRLQGGIVFLPERFIAEGEYVVMQTRSEATTRDGTPYNNVCCFVLRCQGGKIREITEYMDTELMSRALGD